MSRNKKFLDEYKTRVNGIPLVLKNVPVIEKWGSEEILFDFHSSKLHDKMVGVLLERRLAITGGILKFIRCYLDYSLQGMADTFFEGKKTTLAGWEKKLDIIVISDSKLTLAIYSNLLNRFHERKLRELNLSDSFDEVFSESEPIEFSVNTLESLKTGT